MIVYLARSIRGDRRQGDTKTHQMLFNWLEQMGHTPAQRLYHASGHAADTNIYHRDIWRLNQSHALIADVSGASHGVGYEICYAHLVKRIPILLIAVIDAPVISAMLATCGPLYEYRNYEELKQIIQAWFVEIQEGRAADVERP